jgi:undecaprenyl diphosphate synthase
MPPDADTPAVAMPRHVAIIMDGNGRWAETRGLPRIRGHEEGVHAVRAVTRACRKLGVEALTLYSFSTENWGRPGDEVDALMALLVRFLHEERDEIMGNQIRLTASGNLSRLPEPVQQALQFMIEQSSHHSGMVLNLALSYGSRQELVRAVQALAREVQAGTLAADDINEDDIERHLDTAGLPDPDLVIRTSGELRLSNFLLWQVAYSELYITDVLWPDFRESDLMDALAEFAGRRRRFGKTSAQVEATP